MKFTIKHELKNRMRVHLAAEKMTFEQADLFQYYLQEMPGVVFVKVYERTADAVIEYRGSRREILTGIQRFCYENVEVPSGYLENSGRAGQCHVSGKTDTENSRPVCRTVACTVSGVGGRYRLQGTEVHKEGASCAETGENRGAGSGCYSHWCFSCEK